MTMNSADDEEVRTELSAHIDSIQDQARLEGSFNQLLRDLEKYIYIRNMAKGDSRPGGRTRQAQAEKTIKGCIRRWVELNPECICTKCHPEDYEGPLRDCPVHGEKIKDETTEGERS